MAYLYWLHRNLIHTDPYKEGYVGVTAREITDRFDDHRRRQGNLHLQHAFSKYDDIVASPLHTGDIEECLILEKEYRPVRHTGWNSAEGGGIPPKVTEETAKKISTSMKKLGVMPFKPGITNSPQAIAKRVALMVGRFGYHDPVTLKTGMYYPEFAPDGWIRGRKPKQVKIVKVSGIDYGHIASWTITDPTGEMHQVYNLKNWCRVRGVKYGTVFGNHFGWKATKKENAKQR